MDAAILLNEQPHKAHHHRYHPTAEAMLNVPVGIRKETTVRTDVSSESVIRKRYYEQEAVVREKMKQIQMQINENDQSFQAYIASVKSPSAYVIKHINNKRAELQAEYDTCTKNLMQLRENLGNKILRMAEIKSDISRKNFCLLPTEVER